MNERIKKLAEQAGIEVTYDPTEKPMRAFAECWKDELYQFAELIVRECASIVYQTCRDGDAGAQAILYEFDIDNARSQK
jgi:hypothetical protein